MWPTRSSRTAWDARKMGTGGALYSKNLSAAILNPRKALNADLLRTLDEKQIYRIDHYLGKETVQNILVFRFGNSIFEPIWNRNFIDHIQITVAESLGVEGRGGYYDKAGALRDMIPNHILQLVTLTAMEPPVSFEADSVRDEQAKILQAIQPISPEDVLQRAVRGQYGPGVDKWEKSSRLPGGGKGPAGFEYRNVCGAKALDR